MQKLAICAMVMLLISTLHAGSNISPQVLANSLVQEANAHQFHPTGVASYGLVGDLNGSNFTTYQIATNSIYGCVKASSLKAHDSNSMATLRNAAGIQLNTYLIINGTDGTSYSYFLQNFAILDTASMWVGFGDQITNTTSLSGGRLSGISSDTLSGNGIINNVPTGSWYSNVYLLPGNESNYTLPFSYCPITIVDVRDGYPYVRYGYVSNGAVINIDTVAFNISSRSAYLLVSPYRFTPQGTDYDAEFTFGGDSGGANVTFSSLNASNMWIFYGSNGTFKPFPSVYPFGISTIEGTDNLRAEPSGNYVSMGIGKPNLFDSIVLTGQGNGTAIYSRTSNPGTSNESGSG
ncbi:MAG: thermopsin family protease, partial [Candidatus Micrarchaeota archaeon]|nr:thermopsin family protease [Candidatus Micrarchaeota archaeon]